MDRGHLTTEQRLPASETIDAMSAAEIVQVMAEQDRVAVEAVAKVAGDTARVAQVAADCIGRGGRLLYFGAGTSGRLGVLDASECPPTFRADPKQVVGTIAGGTAAMFVAQEGAEDSVEGGAADVDALGVNSDDVCVGIAAGGTTPYVRGALDRAKELGAATAFLACVAAGPGQATADVEIRPITGPEVVTGSTRLKAGTATKLVLNQITTTAFILLGKVYGNLMVDLKASNDKLVDRGVRLIQTITKVEREKAQELLSAANGHVKLAVVMHARDCDAETAAAALQSEGGRLRPVLEKAGFEG